MIALLPREGLVMTPEVPVSPTAAAAPSCDVAAAGLVTVSTEARDGVAVVHIRGEIDVASAELLNETVNARLDAGDDLVLDCTEVTFMDSTGITCFITAQDNARAVVCGWSWQATSAPCCGRCGSASSTPC
ncbi:STAS domain-containing protein [Lentzea sp. HUAS12]|uniref:STAS domain-containing protein n=1 Tax=Lentzea sp. HUAS12 TaxID=2951806 RepID=UPI0020A14415|nr:STAS domain-containing protein [Lentzea sp. HUAS12]USX55625.1 STAS domain-containing protein [Lentzea sp. HUAS12]